ncbi:MULTISPECIES: hypothetical protein [unclassified Spirosoma]|uniref:hypothetical protein n=1 Tax=unclassified Spirosoma TaxID=2621999 RepID=UPI000967AAB5|nr:MULTISPECIES: hypothetical protein [unclassified Spirosoma]MBN8821275.1 hypothetical protein [Spirosoma sp.]OJW78064.1 MAG: hypothetical protein BGO59_29030 [Spirosoma sp. 48-14]
MGFKWNSSKAQVGQLFDQIAERFAAGVIQTLSYLGELCVIQARELNTYRDQTGNLRNSIGYVIVHNGQVVKRNFGKSSKAAKSGGQGVLAGLALANKLASELGNGWGLIVVAGMNYALSVESRGLDVLSSAELLAKTELPNLLTQLKQDLKAKKP